MFIVDGHEDLAVNALFAKRDVRLSVAETRAREREAAQAENADPHAGPTGEAMIGLPELRRDGVIGTVLYNGFVVDGWQRDSDTAVALDDVIRHIDRVCQLAGSARHSAIGSDFDGGFGVESTPAEFGTVADLGKLAEALERHGYIQEDIAGIMGENWLRLLQRALPE